MKAALFIAVGIALLCGLWLVVGFVSSTLRVRRLRRLAESRDGQSAFQEFKAAFPGFSESRAQKAYEFVQRLVGFESFPVKVDDDLWHTLELDQGDVLNELEALFECRGLPFPDGIYQSEAIATARQLAMYFDALSRQAASEPGANET